MVNEEKRGVNEVAEESYKAETNPPSDETSQNSDETVEVVGKGPANIPFVETEEFKNAVKSAADRSLASINMTYAQKLRVSEDEKAKIKREADLKLQEIEWRTRQQVEGQKWVESGLPEDAIQAFQKAQNGFIADVRKFEDTRMAEGPVIEDAYRLKSARTAMNDLCGADGVVRISPLQQQAIIDAASGATAGERLANAKLKIYELNLHVPQGSQNNQVAAEVPKTPNRARKPDTNTSSGAGGTVGRRPTVEELQASTPAQVVANFKSGKWVR
jgi:hypothetical protein